MAQRRCLRCTRLTSRASYCAACKSARDKVYGHGWRQLSKAARQAQPWCSECGSTEDLTLDHITPRSLADGVAVLCRRCNGRKADR